MMKKITYSLAIAILFPTLLCADGKVQRIKNWTNNTVWAYLTYQDNQQDRQRLGSQAVLTLTGKPIHEIKITINKPAGGEEILVNPTSINSDTVDVYFLGSAGRYAGLGPR